MFSVIRERMYSLVDRNRETTKPNTGVFFFSSLDKRLNQRQKSHFLNRKGYAWIEILLIEPEILNRI